MGMVKRASNSFGARDFYYRKPRFRKKHALSRGGERQELGARELPGGRQRNHQTHDLESGLRKTRYDK